MEQTYGGMSLLTLILISVIGGLLFLMVAIYGVMWFMARKYKKNQNLSKGEYDGKTKENTNDDY